MTDRYQSEQLLEEYVKNENLQLHCRMVAAAMEAYAVSIDKPEKIVETWWAAGLLHDIDWEQFPDEHPNVAVQKILPENGYPQEVIDAVKAHAPERTGKSPETEIEKYLFACDELAGFMYAVSLMRPNGFSDMKVKSVTKKLKDKRFAENVPREHIIQGAEFINKDLSEHIRFLISVYQKWFE